ncbi:MAG TPA: efflux transporter outer membrane subunit [Candidatus Binatia bacterium]|nr:efflux transporter outer membrane subunit [Candidatus Binatia bacterium]
MTDKESIGEFRVATAALIFLAAGCAVGPDYQKPDLAVRAAWTEAQQKGVDVRSADLARWWSAFNDPLLNSLVERAVRSNLDLRLAEARIREARASRAVTASGAWPTVDVSGSYTRNRASDNAIGAPAQGAVVAPSGGGANLDQNLYRSGFDANWEIDVFGGVRRSVEAADATLEATVEDRRDVLVTLLGEVAKNYIDLRGFQRQLAVARVNLKTQQDTLELTQVRFQAGLASDLDVAQQEAQVNTTASQIPTLESSLKQAAYGLDVLLGLEPGGLWNELAKETEIPGLPPEVLVGLPSDLLRRRPDIRRAERQLAAATAQVGAATADLFPKFFLTGVAGLQSVSASDWINGGSRFWSIGPRITWPVFDAGRIRANIEVRNAQQEQALTQYEKSILNAFRDVETALVNYANEQARYRSLTEAVAANRRAVTMANELYIRGLNDFLNVLDTQRSLYVTESALTQSQATMATNLVALYKALGGGWESP